MFQPDTLAGNERGAALIEFAFAAPILLSLVLGAVQAGVMLQANSQVKQAIGEAGRAAVVAYQDTSDGVLTAAEVKALVIKEATTKGGLDLRNEIHGADGSIFTDVTRGSGLDVSLYGMGVACGDFDNDGFDDLAIGSPLASASPSLRTPAPSRAQGQLSRRTFTPFSLAPPRRRASSRE